MSVKSHRTHAEVQALDAHFCKPWERRRAPRIKRRDRLFVRFSAGELHGQITSCRSVDVSATGLRLRLTSPAPKGSAIELWVSVIGQPHKFYLRGQVVWCESGSGRGAFEVGVQLRAARGSDLTAWKALFRAL
jgi:hypothetical protein